MPWDILFYLIIDYTLNLQEIECLHVPPKNLSFCQRGVNYMSVNIVNKIPIYIVDSVENKKQFIGKLKNLLIDQSFYSVNKFLNYSYKPQRNHYVQ